MDNRFSISNVAAQVSPTALAAKQPVYSSPPQPTNRFDLGAVGHAIATSGPVQMIKNTLNQVGSGISEDFGAVKSAIQQRSFKPLASLAVAAQIPALLIVSERGTLGDFQIAQAITARVMRPVLQALGIEHHTMTRLDEAHFIVSRTIAQAYKTQAPAALILSPLLTGNLPGRAQAANA